MDRAASRPTMSTVKRYNMLAITFTFLGGAIEQTQRTTAVSAITLHELLTVANPLQADHF
jgi:hypothetical protein